MFPQLRSSVVAALVLGAIAPVAASPNCAQGQTNSTACMDACREKMGWPGYFMGTDAWGAVVVQTQSDIDAAVQEACAGVSGGAGLSNSSASSSRLSTTSSESAIKTSSSSLAVVTPDASLGSSLAIATTSSAVASASSSTSTFANSSTLATFSFSASSSSLAVASSIPPPLFASTSSSLSTSSSTSSAPPAPTTSSVFTSEAPLQTTSEQAAPSSAPPLSSSFSFSSSTSLSPSPSPSTSSSVAPKPAAAVTSSSSSSSQVKPSPITTSSSSSAAPAATTSASTSSTSSSSSSSSTTSQDDINAYLQAHNSIRAQHGASDLTWSDELAQAAQGYSEKCVFQHSGGTLGPFGENLAAGTGDGYGIPQAIKSWTDEVSEYDPNNPVASHFTQVVWKASTQVGCGVTDCDGIFAASFGKAHFYVCEYLVQGNVIGEFAQNVQA